MVKCQICGIEKKISIVEHLRHTHHLTCEEYRNLHKNAEVKSEEAKKIISEQAKKVWQNDQYKTKMCESRQISHRKEDFRRKQSERLKRAYASGLKTWNDGLTKDNNQKLADIGLKNREHLSGRTKEEFEYLQVHSERMKILAPIHFSREEWSEDMLTAWKEKISQTIASGISKGEYNSPVSGYRHGWFIRKNMQKEFYQSSWELEMMNYLDKLDISWTKRHEIVIQYKDENGSSRRYIPDFLIKYKNQKLLLELKGYVGSEAEVEVKKKAAEDWAAANTASYRICRSIQDAQNEVKSFMKDQK